MLWHYVGAAAVAASVGFAAGWQVRSWKAGNDESAALRAAQTTALRRAETAAEEATAHELTRQALQRALRQRQPAVDAALGRPACPDPAASAGAAGPLALGDVLIPADALSRLRLAAGVDQPDGAASEPGPALRPRPADSGR